jgi:DNA-binding Lrp family transcriptional regulator
MKKTNEILALLQKNAKLSASEIAVYLGLSEKEVDAEIKELEKSNIICGYGAFVNAAALENAPLSALIEVKVSLARGEGFNKVAERVSRFDEVKAVYLMSGGYDLAVLVEGKTLADIALFVSAKLAPLEQVLHTATHFVLKKFKDHGIAFCESTDVADRMIISP